MAHLTESDPKSVCSNADPVTIKSLLKEGDPPELLNTLEAVDRLYELRIKPDSDITVNSLNSLKFEVATIREDVDTINENLDRSVEGLVFKLLDKDVHNRKRSVVISGIDGNTGEAEGVTRKNLLPGVDPPTITACHRLSYKNSDAQIICVFMDLDEKDLLMKNAKKLKTYNTTNGTKVSLSQCLPPELSCLHTDLMEQRKELEPDLKKFCHEKFLPRWPYVLLKFSGPHKDHYPIYPKIQKKTIVEKFKTPAVDSKASADSG